MRNLSVKMVLLKLGVSQTFLIKDMYERLDLECFPGWLNRISMSRAPSEDTAFIIVELTRTHGGLHSVLPQGEPRKPQPA